MKRTPYKGKVTIVSLSKKQLVVTSVIMAGVDNWGGMSLTMVDAIDTLLLMGMRAEYERAVGWLYQHYKEAHGKDLWVNTFESTIRILGG